MHRTALMLCLEKKNQIKQKQHQNWFMRFCGKTTVLSSLETQFIFALGCSLEFWAKGTYSEVIYPRPKELHHKPEIKHILCSFWSRIKTADLLYLNARIKNQAGKSAASANMFIQKKKLFVISKPVSVSTEYLKDGEAGWAFAKEVREMNALVVWHVFSWGKENAKVLMFTPGSKKCMFL